MNFIDRNTYISKSNRLICIYCGADLSELVPDPEIIDHIESDEAKHGLLNFDMNHEDFEWGYMDSRDL